MLSLKNNMAKLDSKKVRQIQEWLLQGHLVTDILRNIMESWGQTEEAGIKFIAAAFEDFTNKVKKDYNQTRAYHIQLRLNLYKKAMEDKQFKVALQVLQDLAKIEDV